MRLLGPAVFAWAVCAAALHSRPLLWAAALAVLGTVAVATLSRRFRPAAPAVALAVVLGCTVLVGAAAHTGAARAGPIPDLAERSASAVMHGRVVGDPRLVPANDQRREPLVLLRVRVEQVEPTSPPWTAGGVPQRTLARVRTPVLVFADTSALHLKWGERVTLRGTLATPRSPDSVVATVRPSGPIERAQEAGTGMRAAEHVRGVLRQVTDELPEDARGLVPGMIVGDVSRLPDDLDGAMRATSLTHLSAVSGTNVTYVLLGVMVVVRALGVPRRLRALVGIAAVAAFVVVARPDPSVVRAAVMGVIGLLGVLGSRRGAGLPALGGAVVVLLLVDPFLARSYGFALSVLATAGILLFARPWGQALASLLSNRFPERARVIGYAVSVPLAAQVACTPVLVLLQPSVPLVGVLANLLAGPLVAPVTLGGLVAVTIGLVSVRLGQVVAWVPGVSAQVIAAVARVLAAVPGGAIPWPSGTAGAVSLAGLTLVVLLSGPLLRRCAGGLVDRLGRGGVALLCVAAVVAWVTWFAPWPRLNDETNEWRFAACDVGQGDALLLATGTPGEAVLVDAGRDPVLLDRCLTTLGVTRLAAVVLTHYDGDHVDGIEGALRRRSVGEVVVSAAADHSDFPAELRPDRAQDAHTADHRERALPVSQWRSGDAGRWGDTKLYALSPVQVHGVDPNEGALVLWVDVGGLRVLLLADVEEDASAAVARLAPQLGEIDVVKVSHHGSASVAPQLYSRLGARVAVISVGADNTYGHPAPSVLADLAAAGTPVWRTDEKGTVTVSVDHRGDRRVLSVQGVPTRR